MPMLDLDEICNDCDCLYEFCKLVDSLVKDIQHLESETVRTRYELSQYTDKPYDEYLRSDILSDMAGRYGDNPAYQAYVQLFYNNHDPMNSEKWVEHILKLAHSHESNRYY